MKNFASPAVFARLDWIRFRLRLLKALFADVPCKVSLRHNFIRGEINLRGINMAKGEQPLLQVGWWAAVTVKEGVFPLRCYVGQVEAIGERGVRLTLVDWLTGTATSYDLFVPW